MWQKYKLEEGKTYHGQFATLGIWIQREGKVWHLATDLSKTREAIKPFDIQPPGALKTGWTHHISDSHTSLYILPALPDRPVVVKPVENYTVLPEMQLDILVQIPLWIQLYASSVKPEQLMLDIPVEAMSSTWFGDPVSGELAYSLPGELFLKMEELSPSSKYAVCPVRIRNLSDTTLNFERLSLHANQLNIYENKGRLFTNEVRVKYRGEDQQSEVQIVSGSPAMATGSSLLASARIRENKGLLQKSFYFIKSFTQY